MRLSSFIRQNREDILQEWERFANDLVSAPDEMSARSLRDHAAGLLGFLADALETPRRIQTGTAAEDQAAAQGHGDDRMQWGFTVGDMAAEFRALRSSVIHLWAKKTTRMRADDLIRFNEALDQALAESIQSFSSHKERQTRLLEGMLSYSSDQCAIFDRSGVILYANPAMARAYAVHPREMIGRSVGEFDQSLASEVHQQTEFVLSTGNEYRGDFTVTTAKGETHVVDFVFAPIHDQAGKIDAIALNSRDVTERKELERTLWQHANHDHLTGVPNRRLFFDRLEQDLRIVKRANGLLALLYIDLDKFKVANDRLGHDAGDLLLKEAAQRIESCTRETDTVARMGGDEFAVILVGAGDRQHVEAVSRAILSRVTRPFTIDEQSVYVGASIGIAIYPGHGDTVSELTTRADAAMYVAKNMGGERFSFYSPEDEEVYRRRREVRAIARPPRIH